VVPVALASVLLASAAIPSHAQSKPARHRPGTSQQTVPAPHWASGKTVDAKTTGPAATKPARPEVCTHSVRSGESISRIAIRYRVSRGALIDANRLVDPHALRSGQRLIVPGCRAPIRATAGEMPGTQPGADGILIKRVGPRRILTSLVLTEPDFQGNGPTLTWPAEGPVISTFGRRSRSWHAGIDIKAEVGSEIRAAAAGIVLYSGWIRAYGQVVKIQHPDGFITLYTHNEKNMVEVGEEVEVGQLIATVGRTGHTTGPHLHFEVRRDGKAYNPLHLLGPSDQSPVFEADMAALGAPSLIEVDADLSDVGPDLPD
jgi:murein DD-endopeptidase MepM/ murein hydrolase activator NlpD